MWAPRTKEVRVAFSLSPEQRTQRARIAAHTRWSKALDPTEATRPAREGFDKRFYDKVDPKRILDPETRERLAMSARKAYFTRLAYKSARARSQRTSL